MHLTAELTVRMSKQVKERIERLMHLGNFGSIDRLLVSALAIQELLVEECDLKGAEPLLQYPDGSKVFIQTKVEGGS